MAAKKPAGVMMPKGSGMMPPGFAPRPPKGKVVKKDGKC
jgi:hypothetical protein